MLTPYISFFWGGSRNGYVKVMSLAWITLLSFVVTIYKDRYNYFFNMLAYFNVTTSLRATWVERHF